jgi:5-(carboxyamino)imidazole ribonucleotide synthase
MSSQYFYNKKLGILGGGQLGKMLCVPAAYWHLNTYILDPSANCPASVNCKNVQQGDFTDFDTVYNFGKELDVITIEIENVNVDALVKLKAEGKEVYPDPEALKVIKDKGLQKAFYEEQNIKTSAFKNYADKAAVIAGINSGEIKYPFVQKLRTEGYDGKGVAVVNSADDLELLLDGLCLVEEKINFTKELAVVAARDVNGNVKCFDIVEMVFDDKANLVTSLLCPAQVSESIAKKAEELATQTINAFGIVGLLAVELFLDKNDEIYVNEVAPRPHNSGHHTIEACVTSQYEQHLRAVMGAPLGSTQTILPSVMINLLGEAGCIGKAVYRGMEECMKIPGVNVHIYGKADTRPNRKMGHVTIVDNTVTGAQEKAEFVQKTLRVIA